ncbi:hypothetical protein C0995_004373 [Termitomyces sp. Mi166|nr:hypothetical protein C0995_004373 [Termitomyces sp. Mi166\
MLERVKEGAETCGAKLSIKDAIKDVDQAPPPSKGKGKAKVMEEDNDEEDEVTQKLREELKIFIVLTKFSNKPLAGLLLPLMEYYEEDIGLSQGAKILGRRKGKLMLVVPAMQALVLEKNGMVAKAFLKQQGKPSQSFILEGFKGNGKAKALIANLEQTDAKQAFKLKEVVDSNSNKEEEERVCVIKKIKCEHIKEPIGVSKEKETIELQATVAPKMPMARPSDQTLKPIVLISGTPNLAPKLTVAVPVPKPAPVKSAVRQFKLADTEESGALIINQVTEVAAGKVASTVTQKTLQSEEDTSDKNNNDKGSNCQVPLT